MIKRRGFGLRGRRNKKLYCKRLNKRTFARRFDSIMGLNRRAAQGSGGQP